MFTLTIDNKQLILDPDFGVPLLYKNPCWCFNEIPGPLCLDVTIPDNDVNRNYLGFPGRFAKMAKSNDRKFPRAELRWRGFPYIYGTLVISKADDKGYSGYIKSELRSLADAQREKFIYDHQLLGELTFENKPNYNPDEDMYCTVRLQNRGFWVGKGDTEPWTKVTYNADGSKKPDEITEREILTRKFDETVDFMVNAFDAEGVKTSSDINGAVVVSPFPFLSRLIKELLQENKFFMRNDFLKTDDDLKTLCLYHNTSICEPEVFTVITTVKTEPYHDETLESLPQPDDVTEVRRVSEMSWKTNQFQLNKLIPKMELNELLLSVQNLTNTFFHFSGINDVDNIDRESLFDMEPFDLSKYRVSRWLPGTRQNLRLKFTFNHDSDDQEFNENFTDITSREEDIKDPVSVYSDLSAIVLPDIGEIRLVASEKMYYEYRMETVDAPDGKSQIDVLKWSPLSIDIQDYIYNPGGDETEDIETLFSTLRMHKGGYPVAYQKGNNQQFSQYTENFTPRLLFYNGNNTGGSIASSGLALDWKSLVKNRYRRTAPFYANALPVEANFRFPGNIFYKVLNEIYRPFLDIDGSFFIKEMQVQANNSEYVDATLTVFKNEDNVFTPAATGEVDGGGEHVGTPFVPKFVGVTESGWPILVDAEGLQRPMPVFGDISLAAYAAHTCVAYDSTDKLLFVGGNNGQLHICDLSDMDNIRYKTIQIYAGTDDISGVSIVSDGTTKRILIGKANGSAAWSQPYYQDWASYQSGWATQTAAFDHGTGHVRGFIYYNGYYYACTSEGEVFRTNNFLTVWSQLADIDGGSGYNAAMVQIKQTANRIWVAELHDDSLYALKSNPTQYVRFNGLTGSKRQAVRDIQPMTGDHILWLCADAGECIWEVNPTGSINRNITPSGIANAGGACFDGTKFAYISVRDGAGFCKIASYNPAPVFPQAMWSYLNVSSFFTKLFLY